jgi:hypothetical protein
VRAAMAAALPNPRVPRSSDESMSLETLVRACLRADPLDATGGAARALQGHMAPLRTELAARHQLPEAVRRANGRSKTLVEDERALLLCAALTNHVTLQVSAHPAAASGSPPPTASATAAVFPLPSALAKTICSALGVPPADLEVSGSTVPADKDVISLDDSRISASLRHEQPPYNTALFELLCCSRKASACYGELLRGGNARTPEHRERCAAVAGARHFEGAGYALRWEEAMAGFMPAFRDVYAAIEHPQLVPPPPQPVEAVVLPDDEAAVRACIYAQRHAVLDPRRVPTASAPSSVASTAPSSIASTVPSTGPSTAPSTVASTVASPASFAPPPAAASAASVASPAAPPPAGGGSREWEVAVAEPYGWDEGGSDPDWVLSYKALRVQLVRLGKRGCLFTRRYYSNFTLNIAILSEDDQSITQVLLGAAVLQ